MIKSHTEKYLNKKRLNLLALKNITAKNAHTVKLLKI